MKAVKSVTLFSIIIVVSLAIISYINFFNSKDAMTEEPLLTTDFKIDSNISNTYSDLIHGEKSTKKIIGATDDDSFIFDNQIKTEFLIPFSNTRSVIIDAGHGGIDPGAFSGSVFEKNIVLDIVKKVKILLGNTGISAFLTREDDSFISINNRITAANNINGLMFVSIHCDSHDDPELSGTHTLYCDSYNSELGATSEKIAKTIQTELSKRLETVDRGILKRDDLSVLKYPKMPSVLVELAFISNEFDKNVLMTERFKDKAAFAIAKGISKSLENID